MTETYLDRHIGPVADLRALDPDFAASAEAIYGHPYRNATLEPRIASLVVLAAETVIPQADPDRAAAAAARAADDGATADEILCTLEIACSIGMHTVSVGLPILLEEMAAAGLALPAQTPEQDRLQSYLENEGPRPRPLNSIYAAILRMDPAYFEARIHFIDLPWERLEVLDPKVKHLLSIAIDAVSPQHYSDGLRKHIQQALEIGVAPQEILEVLELTSVTSLRTFDAALPAVRSLFTETSAST